MGERVTPVTSHYACAAGFQKPKADAQIWGTSDGFRPTTVVRGVVHERLSMQRLNRIVSDNQIQQKFALTHFWSFSTE
jgi:hypothetical protein